MNCSFCGLPIPAGAEAVLEAGITLDLNALYHPNCFRKKELNLATPKKKDRLHVRHDHGVVSEPGVGD